MARLRDMLFLLLVWILFCTAYVSASGLKDNRQPVPASEGRAVQGTCSDVEGSEVGKTSCHTDSNAKFSIPAFAANTFHGVAESLGGVAQGVGRSVEGTVRDLGKCIEGTVGALGHSPEGPADTLGQSRPGVAGGLGQFVEDTGEIVFQAAYVSVKVVVVVILYGYL